MVISGRNEGLEAKAGVTAINKHAETSDPHCLDIDFPSSQFSAGKQLGIEYRRSRGFEELKNAATGLRRRIWTQSDVAYYAKRISFIPRHEVYYRKAAESQEGRSIFGSGVDRQGALLSGVQRDLIAAVRPNPGSLRLN